MTAAAPSAPPSRDLPAITFVTSSTRKFQEAVALVGDDAPFRLVRQAVDLPELQGEPRDIILAKCRAAASATSGPVICEDVSLHFSALNGLPGPYIKWFMDKIGHEGLNNLLAAYEDKSATAVCELAFAKDTRSDPVIFQGICFGRIVPPRARDDGEGSFCWDAIFEPCGSSLTFAEMTPALKNLLSHRARAFAHLTAFIAEHPEQLYEAAAEK